MANENTTRMLAPYRQLVGRPDFLAGMFESPARNFHNTEDVEVDIIRENEEVAIEVADVTSSARMNQATVYTNKRFTPAVYKEAGPVSAYELMKRLPGNTPYDDPDYQAAAQFAALEIARRCRDKIRRRVEMQAASVLQTGKLALVDAAGNPTLTVDFKPNTDHFFTTGTSWATSASCLPLDDIESLGDKIRRNGKVEVTDIIFGRVAYMHFVKSAQVQGIADNRRYNLVYLNAPEPRGAGAKYVGTLTAGSLVINMWTYDGQYKDPVSGNIVKYVTEDKVIVLGPGRKDLTWGNIPRIGGMDPRVLPYLPQRVSSSSGGMDLIQTAWLEKDGSGITVQVGARPLCIPTAIDTFGCIDTVP